MTSLFRKAKEKFDASQANKREQSAQRAAYSAAVMQLAQPGADVQAILKSLPGSTAFKSNGDKQRLHDQAFTAIANAMLEDDLLDLREEEGLLAAADALGVTNDRLNLEYKSILERVLVAKVNDGRLPVLDEADVRLPLKGGEIAHLTTPATLYKWQSVREYKSGGGGFTLRVMKGVYYHTGRTTGRSVIVGQNLVPDDSGILTITNKRAVFSGAKKSLQFEYTKLLDVELFTDGIKLAVSNRQSPSLMKFDVSGDVVGAVLNAAAGQD